MYQGDRYIDKHQSALVLRGFPGSDSPHRFILACEIADSPLLFLNWPLCVSALDIALSVFIFLWKLLLNFTCLCIPGVIIWYS